MDTDIELDAMSKIRDTLAGLDEPTTARVLRWAFDRYKVTPSVASNVQGQLLSSDRSPRQVSEAVVYDEFEDVASLLAASGASTDAERALVVGYWFQRIQGQPNLEAQQINSELTHTGNHVSNITRALSALMDRKPQLVIQIHKSGSAKQARKKYKLTVAGIKKVEAMLAGKAEEDE